ncbi:metallophosphoesterase [Brevibacillus ginsengisoli]|uniref:metallophosphoesterase n=1 Tax=Brevibacillus ginsengisoli TaxID=363854 RepID=UPI003CF52FB7
MLWLLVLVALVIFVKAYRNTFHPALNRIHIPLSSDGLNKESEPIRILHLSDLHMENISISAEQIVKDLKHEPIDLLAITGDFLDRKRSIPRAIAFVETLQKLRPTLGTFVVFGNHDYVLPPNQLAYLKVGLERIGCQILCNETKTVMYGDTKLHIIGVDDYHTRRSNLEKSYQHVTEDGIRLILTHDPTIVLKMKQYDYDYMLAGHFHGGQIHYPKAFHLWKMGKLARMNIVKGLHYRDNRPFYISEGLGQTGLNIRLRSRPEITIHTLATTNETAPSLALD